MFEYPYAVPTLNIEGVTRQSWNICRKIYMYVNFLKTFWLIDFYDDFLISTINFICSWQNNLLNSFSYWVSKVLRLHVLRHVYRRARQFWIDYIVDEAWYQLNIILQSVILQNSHYCLKVLHFCNLIYPLAAPY